MLLSATPSLAQVRRCEAPPGRAGVEQYCESIPGPGGQQGGDSGAGSGPNLDRRTRERLRAAGADGSTLAELAEAAPRSESAAGGGAAPGDDERRGSSSVGDGGTSDGGAGAAEEGGAKEAPSDNVFKALTSAVSDGPTAGRVLAWALILVAIGMFAAAWMLRRRQRSD